MRCALASIITKIMPSLRLEAIVYQQEISVKSTPPEDENSSTDGESIGLSEKVIRPISIARLHTLLCVHLQPINLVVSQEAYMSLRTEEINLRVSFPLRCFQRLSRPNIATGQCT